jgi:hypothetical protein
MTRPLDRVPDGIAPLEGYRAWAVIEEGDGVVFRPLWHGARDWEGATRGWVSASCPREQELRVSPRGMILAPEPHEVPAEGCTCGFYAMKELAPELNAFARSFGRAAVWPRAGACVVLGRVELSGKVIEHDEGYRAERARIVELIPIRGTERTVQTIGRRAGVPIGAPLKLRRAARLRGRVRLVRKAWAASKAAKPPLSEAGPVSLTLLAVAALAFVGSNIAMATGAAPSFFDGVWMPCLVLHGYFRARRSRTTS